jgi:hypothetical protein
LVHQRGDWTPLEGIIDAKSSELGEQKKLVAEAVAEATRDCAQRGILTAPSRMPGQLGRRLTWHPS